MYAASVSLPLIQVRHGPLYVKGSTRDVKKGRKLEMEMNIEIDRERERAREVERGRKEEKTAKLCDSIMGYALFGEPNALLTAPAMARSCLPLSCSAVAHTYCSQMKSTD